MKFQKKLACAAIGSIFVSQPAVYAQTVLDPVFAEAVPYNAYSDSQALVSAGTRIPARQLESSRSVQAIGEKAIEDQGNANALQAMQRNVPGIGSNSNLAGNRSNFMLRGFNIHDNDGTKVDGQYNLTWADLDLFNIEQIQVEKGPNAAFGGKSDAGGHVNYVTKKADWTGRFDFFQTFSTDGSRAGSIQKNWAISDALAGRTVLSYGEGKNGALDGPNNTKDRLYFSQNFMANLGEATKLEVDLRHSYDKQNYGNSSQLMAIGSLPAQLKTGTNLASPFDRFNVEEDSVGARLVHDFNTELSWHSMAKFQRVDRLQQYLGPKSLAGPLLSATYNLSDSVKTYESYDNWLEWKRQILGKKNILIGGYEYTNADTEGWNRSSSSIYKINIYNPSFNGFAWAYGAQTKSASNVRTGGYYLQDRLFLSEKLILSGGLRYDEIKQSSVSYSSAGAVTAASEEKFGKSSGNVGVVYKFTPNMSVYADYATGFIPQNLSNSGVPVSSLLTAPPQSSTQKEVGYKYVDQRGYSLTAAAFEVGLTNLQTPDPANPALSIFTGEARSRGFELQGTAVLSGKLSAVVNYARVNATVVKDNPDSKGASNLGNRLASVPPVSYGAWLMWDDRMDGKPWGAGLGFNRVGERAGDLQNDFVLPAYTVYNASVYYEPWKNARLQLTLNNITDEKYYAGSNSRFNIMQGQPFAGMLSIHIKY